MSEDKIVNLDEISDTKEIKALMADQFMLRENAKAQIRDSNNNITLMNNRLIELQTQKVNGYEPPKSNEYPVEIQDIGQGGESPFKEKSLSSVLQGAKGMAKPGQPQA